MTDMTRTLKMIADCDEEVHFERQVKRELLRLHDLLGKANALAKIRATRIAELEAQLAAVGTGGVGPLMKGTHREQHLDMVPLPRAVVEHVMYHLNRGDDDAVCWADGVIKPALEQPQRKRFADECINMVAFHGGSVEIEAAIRARGQA